MISYVTHHIWFQICRWRSLSCDFIWHVLYDIIIILVESWMAKSYCDSYTLLLWICSVTVWYLSENSDVVLWCHSRYDIMELKGIFEIKYDTIPPHRQVEVPFRLRDVQFKWRTQFISVTFTRHHAGRHRARWWHPPARPAHRYAGPCLQSRSRETMILLLVANGSQAHIPAFWEAQGAGGAHSSEFTCSNWVRHGVGIPFSWMLFLARPAAGGVSFI